MKNKRKKKKRRKWVIFSLLIILSVFLFKNRTSILTAKKEVFNPLIKIEDGMFLNEDGKIIKMKDSLNLPLIKGYTDRVMHKKISSLYPCVEIFKIIKYNYPELMDSIDYINIKDYTIVFKNKKRVILGLGNYEEKLKFLFENYRNFKKRLDLKILTFKKRRF